MEQIIARWGQPLSQLQMSFHRLPKLLERSESFSCFPPRPRWLPLLLHLTPEPPEPLYPCPHSPCSAPSLVQWLASSSPPWPSSPSPSWPPPSPPSSPSRMYNLLITFIFSFHSVFSAELAAQAIFSATSKRLYCPSGLPSAPIGPPCINFPVSPHHYVSPVA